jgi:tRNA pseudouridine13 synthase
MKDAQAVAQQTLSLLHVEPEELDKLVIPGMRILWVARHRNKLRTGHLKGNRFTIRIRDVGESCLPRAERIIHDLAQHGIPNHYGQQRFGQRANSHLLGRDLLVGDAGAFLSKFLGTAPGSAQGAPSGLELEARMRYDAGDLGGALQLWPSGMPDERRALAILAKSGSDVDAMESVPRRLCRFLLSAYQSHLFNQIVATRLPYLHRILEGDLAWKHDSGAVFLVADADSERLRAERFEISPSGPMFGYKVALAQGEPGRAERGVLRSEGVSLEDFRSARGPRAAGARRPLRVPLKEPTHWFDDGLILRFELPAGSYATNVLREVMKQDV